MDRCAVVKCIVIVLVFCCISAVYAQQSSGPSGIGIGPGRASSGGFVGNIQIAPGPSGIGIGPGRASGSGPPPTCNNVLDFSQACNSQYLALGGIV